MFGKLAVLSAILTIISGIAGLIKESYMIPVIFIIIYMILFLLWIISCFTFTRFINMKKKYNKESKFFRRYTNCIIDSLMQLMRVKIHVTGLEHLPAEKFLLAGNHKSAFDPLITMGVLRKYNMGFIAKKVIFRIPIICRLMHRCFCLSLDRDNMRQQAETIKRAAEIIKSQEASIGIYPEGTRNRSNELLPFMNGAFKIAKKADCPVVVAAIRNPELIAENIPFRKTDVYLDVIGVLDKKFISEHTTKEIGNIVFNMISENIKNNNLTLF